MAATETAPPPAPARRPGRRLAIAVDVAVLVGIVALVAFPLGARIAADRLPRAAPPLLAPLPAGLSHPPLQDLPAGLKPGSVDAAATALLGERRGRRLMRVVRTGTTRPGDFAESADRYPYRYPWLERILPARFRADQVAAATDLGAKLTLLGSGAAGFAVLDRARAGGACAPSLDVLLLVASEVVPRDGIVTREAEAAHRACPGDPTALWLLGEYRSLEQDTRATATFARLARELPGSGAAWAGLGDDLIRRAATTPPLRPWVARHLYQRALADYRLAARLSPDAEVRFGEARALAGLGQPHDALAAQRREPAPAAATVAQAQLVTYLEGAHRWADAAAAAGRLQRLPKPAGPAQFPAVPPSEQVLGQQVDGLISLGAGRFAPLTVVLRPRYSNVGASQGGYDLTFIPVFRDSPGETGTDRWCPAWSQRRDAVLAGQAAAALAGYPRDFQGLAGHDSSCADASSGSLAGIARIEAGDVRAARRSGLQDARQNLFRWAGDFAHAERAAREWVHLQPAASLPLLRLGEIEFRRHRYDDAARDFGAAARRARERTRPHPADEAQALLDRGAALVAAGRRAEGEDALRTADDVASRLYARQRDDPTMAATSYYARAQLGDAARAAGALPAAGEAYAAARERVRVLKSAKPPVRREQFEDNAAIVDIALGRPAAAEASMRAALAIDPENPEFLMTAGYAAERAGHAAAAMAYDRAALAADPGAAPAANDLGVLLARAGRDGAAVAALRRAVGADERYALGWFNLGVVLAGQGPAHLLASQGALARAFSLDPKLRERERRPWIDANTYDSGLDISRPLPPEWSFASTQRHAPAKTAGLAAVLAALFGLSRVLQARSGRALAERWLEPLDRVSAKLKPLGRVRHPAIAVAITLALLLWPLARDPGGGATAAVAGALGLVLLVAIALRGRAAVARRGEEPPGQGQRTWPPGVALGVGAAAAGLLWTPLPVLGAKASPRLHWAAPAALAVVAVPLVVATVWLDVPLTRSLAAAALVMAASLLTPVKPVDGGAIAAAGGTAAGIAGIALAAVLALGLA